MIRLLVESRNQPLPGRTDCQAGRGGEEKAVKAVQDSAVTRKQIAEVLDVAPSLDKRGKQVAGEGGRYDETASNEALRRAQTSHGPQHKRSEEHTSELQS